MRDTLPGVEFGKANGIKPCFLGFVGRYVKDGFRFSHALSYHKDRRF